MSFLRGSRDNREGFRVLHKLRIWFSGLSAAVSFRDEIINGGNYRFQPFWKRRLGPRLERRNLHRWPGHLRHQRDYFNHFLFRRFEAKSRAITKFISVLASQIRIEPAHYSFLFRAAGSYSYKQSNFSFKNGSKLSFCTKNARAFWTNSSRKNNRFRLRKFFCPKNRSSKIYSSHSYKHDCKATSRANH